jgi:hypothetical protein
VRVVSPAPWTATTGSQSANLTFLFEPDGAVSWVRVRPQVAAPAAQFLTALVPIATSAWDSRVRIDALSDSDPGAGAVVAPGTAQEERWIFGRAGGDGYAAGDLALTSSLVGMAGRNAGAPARALLVGPGKLSDRNGTREILSSRSANVIEADLQGDTLVVTGDGISDFHAYAPAATLVRVNREPASAAIVDGVVIYPAADALDAGTLIDGGTGVVDGGPGDLENPPDGGSGIPENPLDGGSGIPVNLSGPAFPRGGWGCATGGAVVGVELLVLLAIASARRRRR